jgi:nicotinate-nucleotide--dimethylbenzimidazole phosphoribosyltransferase
VVFAGDHGVSPAFVTEGTPPTAARVRDVLGGVAAVNAFARHHDIGVEVVDVGVAGDLAGAASSSHATFRSARVRGGTRDMVEAPALTRAEVEAAIAVGLRCADDAIDAGAELLGAGEIHAGPGIAAAAILAAATGMPGKLTASRAPGMDDADLARVVTTIDAALALHRPDRFDAWGMLQAFGGLETAAIAGLCLGAAARGVPVVLDGFASTAGGLMATTLESGVTPWLLVGHKAAENAHWAMSRYLAREPLHDLDLAHGEGTGAVLAMDSVRLAARLLAGMTRSS